MATDPVRQGWAHQELQRASFEVWTWPAWMRAKADGRNASYADAPDGALLHTYNHHRHEMGRIIQEMDRRVALHIPVGLANPVARGGTVESPVTQVRVGADPAISLTNGDMLRINLSRPANLTISTQGRSMSIAAEFLRE